jgi:hypothetical protein
MAVQMVHETTILGDKYGKQVKQNGVVIQTATRTFTVEVDNAADRSIEEVYAILPKKGDSHPYITNNPACLVKDIAVVATKDPHIYEATVEYSTEVDLNDDAGGDDDEDAPWNQPGIVTIGVDTSNTVPSEHAYLEWPYTEVGTMATASLGTPIGDITGNGPPSRPVTNKPMNEKFTTVPEEPSGGVAINVSFAEKAARTGSVLSTQTLTDLISEALTVNTGDVTFAGYSIGAYKGYVSDVNSELAFYRKTPRHKPVPYFNIRITLLVNPKTWIRYIQNMSRNQLSADEEGNKYLSPIQVADKTSGLKADVKEPVLIHPHDGKALGFDADGYAIEDNRIYVIPYLTKRPGAWTALINILNRVLS